MPPIISVAPMMGCTDRHDRYFLRLISPDVQLYTEMLTAQAITYGDKKRLLAHDPSESYLALQLGGNNPPQLAECAKEGELAGYDEINLNVGCPSDRVKSGKFGACLMLEPTLVANCIAAMQKMVSKPVTVKCRIGVDDKDSFDYLKSFIQEVAATGCERFIIHARKAWLSGLSPKQNREIPPLNYQTVYDLKQTFPHLTIIINGGIKTVAEIKTHLNYVDGVMLGRVAYANPFILSEIQNTFYTPHEKERHDVIMDMLPYIESALNQGIKLGQISRHLVGLFLGRTNGAIWRRYLSENAYQPNAGIEILQKALTLVPR